MEAILGVYGDYKFSHDAMKNSSETHVNVECDGKCWGIVIP